MQAQQKRMESRDVVAQQADVVVKDASSGGTALDMDKLTREAFVNLLSPFASGAGAAEHDCQAIRAFNAARTEALIAKREMTIHRQACGFTRGNFQAMDEHYPIPPKAK